ncbi:MAG: adenylate/guanylate cyclase domain-containing protein [Crocinitomicaceae bacterium]|nr:adenylate/guanylate cyclase domain-containing protein [Crocinitomicaceae bacterium]
MWVATEKYGVLSFDLRSKKFKPLQGLKKRKKTHLIKQINKTSLLVYAEPYYNTSEFINFNPITNKYKSLYFHSKNGKPVIVNKFVQKNAELILVATNQGVYSYNLKTDELISCYENIENKYGLISIKDIVFAQNKTFLASQKQGIFTIGEDGKTSNSVEDDYQSTSLLFNRTNCLFKDYSGSIWIGSERGLSNFDPNNSGFLGVGASANKLKGLESKNVWCFEESKSRTKIYIGTDKGISVFNRVTEEFKHYKRSVQNTADDDESIILSLKEIDDKTILAGCLDGLFVLKINDQHSYSFNYVGFLNAVERNRYDRIYKIVHYKDSKYFLATRSGVILFDYVTQSHQKFNHIAKKANQTILPGACRLAFKDKNGKFWFATNSGLSCLNETINGELEIVPYKKNKNLLDENIASCTACYIDAENNFWFGSSGTGLVFLNPEKGEIKKYNKKNSGLPNNVVYGVLRDSKQNFWLSTNKGLSKFNVATKRAINYTDLDGLMSNEFNMGASLQASNGEMFFGGIFGYNYFLPKNLSLKKNNVKVVFTGLKLDSSWVKPNEKGSPLKKPLSLTKELILSYDQRSFSVRFQASDLSSPNLLRYKYILEGSDEGEIDLGPDNYARFSSLSPGTYTLKVYAKIGEGKWSENPAILKITIKAPFWWKVWFWLVVSLVIGLAIYFYVKQQIQKGKQKQLELEKRIEDRTKEITAQKTKIEKQNSLIQSEKEKVEKQQELLKKEQKKSEELLLNLLPESTVKELMAKGKSAAKAFKTVSVMFTDVVGFTKISENMPPSRLVSKLDVMFRKFDEIIVENNLEKIKTIGDAYMCAAGVPEISSTNPMDACIAALQIQDYMERVKYDAIANHEDFWEIRLGINTGNVTAGVIGSERLAYDIWGSTVNQAQRMEMLGEPGKVCVSGSTFDLIEPYFECEYKGKVPTKSKGLVDMYVVKKIKSELSINNKGLKPNKRFHEIVNLHHYSSIKYYKAEHHVIKMLKNGLSKDLIYHSLDHTLDVLKAVEHYALLEGVTDEALFLLKTAAIFHDAGFIEKYENNEAIGARLAEENLPKFGFKQDHIETIKSLIHATQIPHKPINKLQEIICDADLDYLGTDQFEKIADKLRVELRNMNKIDSDRKWDEIQLKFLNEHRFFTKTAIKTRTKKKQENIKKVIERLEKGEYVD